ncbi:MAG TPA: AAA family ATPase [Acidimicrobiia bacterium]|nr:AAA family ATPase [Acidimicrobiia bacterium]
MTIAVDEQRRLFVDWLERRSSDPVELRETHVSLLAFQGDRVFKMKKAVCFPFIDLSTTRLRHQNCAREVELNRRFAPDVYLGVVEVADPSRGVVEHAVEMHRLDPARSLHALALIGRGKQCVERVADDLARFHAHARRSPEIDEVASTAGVARLWTDGIDELERFAGTVLDPDALDEVARLADRFVLGRSELFAARIASGRICDGHGDLLTDDVFCTDDGPWLLDCLEFDDRLRWGDVLADVAFLAMDLERVDRADLARALLDRYREQAHDDWPPSLEHFYVAYRAFVRTKVACLRFTQHDAGAADEARSLLALARAHLERGRVRLVLIGGAPGTGKTTLARAVADATGWRLLRSDVVRKQLAGLSSTQHTKQAVDEGLYTNAWTERTYEKVLRLAARELARGASVIIDASFAQPRWRAAAAQVGAEHVTDLDAWRCEAPVEIASARVARRRHDASDADAAVASVVAGRFEPWPEAHTVETSGEPAAAIRRVLGGLGVATGSGPSSEPVTPNGGDKVARRGRR